MVFMMMVCGGGGGRRAVEGNRVWGLGLRVLGSGFKVYVLGLGVRCVTRLLIDALSKPTHHYMCMCNGSVMDV